MCWRIRVRRASFPIVGIVTFGVLLVVIFLLCVAFCRALYVATFGIAPPGSIPNFLRQLHQRDGWPLIFVGNGVGFVFAVLVLMISVVSFPLLSGPRSDWCTLCRAPLLLRAIAQRSRYDDAVNIQAPRALKLASYVTF
jgi:uncharacterized membrane protein